MKEPADSRTSGKIGIIGPKSVGKTTLANLLNGHLKSLGASSDLVFESARNCPLPLNEKTTIESAYWLFGAQIAAEAVVQAKRDFTICDRTVIDIYAFAKYSNKEEPSEQMDKMPSELEALKTLIEDYVVARPYEFVFYVPVRQELTELDLAPSDRAFQTAIDIELRAFLHELPIDYYELKESEGYGRLEEAMACIQSKYPFLHSSRSK